MFEQVKLAYATDALEPHIDKETVETHHGKHHATYTTNLNNYNLYFSTISPNGGGEPEGRLAAKINESFGSFAALKEKLTNLALSQFGSGWAWLEVDEAGNLSASSTLNQDNPISLGTGKKPIVAIDVWEHAYYLKYKNLRADYVKALFEVIDWKLVAEKYDAIAG